MIGLEAFIFKFSCAVCLDNPLIHIIQAKREVFFLFFLIKVQLITMLYKFLLYSIVTNIYIYIYTHTLFFSYRAFHHVLYQETGYTSLYHTGGHHCLSILNLRACIYPLQTPQPSHSLPLPFGNYKSVLYICESVSVL